jgi:hypothetical protein
VRGATVHIQVADVQAWLEPVKCPINSLEPVMELDLSTQVLSRLAAGFEDPTTGVPTWADFNSTPTLVKQAIAMLYAAWFYDRQYSEVEAGGSTGIHAALLGVTSYGALLRRSSDTLIAGMLSGSILIPELGYQSPSVSDPVFYPDDRSSTSDAVRSNTDRDDHSLGPSLFGTSKVF